MDLIWLEDFLAVVEEGGFSRAAYRRHVTQPALSRRIKALEDWLGAPLFERKSHTLTLTPAGENFHAVAEDVMRCLTVGREEALQAARLKAETIYFAGTHALSQTFFPDWIRDVDRARGGAAIQLFSANFAGCEKILLDARVHFMLAHHHPLLVTRLNSIRSERLELDKDVLIPVCAPLAEKRSQARKKNRKASPRFVLPGTASEPLPYLSYHPGSGVGRIVNAFLAAKKPAACLQPGFSAPVTLLINLAREGKGITWAPVSLVRSDLANGQLVRAGPAEWDIEISICLYRLQHRMTKVAESFWSEVHKFTRKRMERHL
jgi:DNA-binding transcriptional LysR family regulator